MDQTSASGSPVGRATRLHKSLSTVEYFTFGFGSMIGVGLAHPDG